MGDEVWAARVAVERHDLVERLAADDDAGGMGGGVAIEAFHLLGDVEKAGGAFVIGGQFAQAGFAGYGVLEAHGLGGVEGDEAGDFVHLAIGHAEHAADIAHGGFGLQLAEGDDLAHPVGAIFAADVIDHLAAAVLAEINVEIGHGDAFGVEEALEEQAPAQRVEIGDGERPGGDGTRTRATAGADGDALSLRPLDEIGDDEEVAGEAHRLDHAEFVFEAGLVGFALGEDLALEAFFQAAAGHVGHGFGLGHARLHFGADGEGGFFCLRHHRAEFGDGEGVVAGLGQVVEQGAHFGGGLEIVVGGDAAALGLGHGAAFGDAEQRVMRLVHFGQDEIDVVGGDDGQGGGVGEGELAGFGGGVALGAVAVQFDGEAAGEEGGEVGEEFFRLRAAAFGQEAGDGAMGAAGEEVEARGVMGQGFEADGGAAGGVFAEIAGTAQALEVFEAGGVHGEGDQDIGLQAGGLGPGVGGGAGEPELAAHDGLDAAGGAGLGEFQGAEEIAGIGDCHSRHGGIEGELRQFLGLDRALAEGIAGMGVQVDEGLGHGPCVASAGLGVHPYWPRGLQRLMAGEKGERALPHRR